MTDHDAHSPPSTAKITPPELRASGIRAPQLATAAEAAGAKLLLVRAPAGYGKTTLVAAAAEQLGWSYVWYRLDALDADPRAFLTSLTHAVRAQRPAFGRAFLAHTRDAEAASPAALAVAFARELEQLGSDRLFLILDAYEVVATAPAFNESLATLLDSLPPTTHLVVLTRVRPSFPVATLALDGRLLEISHRDLALDRDQVAQILQTMRGAPVEDATVKRILRLTEGWAAGVCLAGQVEVRAAADAEAQRACFPYLAEQVYARLSEGERAFLRETCCLATVSRSLGEVVTGAADAGSTLERLEAGGAFVFSDPPGDACRVHPLFRAFLQDRLLLAEGQSGLSALQLRTARVLADRDLFVPAVELYVAAGSLEPTLEILRRRGHELLDESPEALLTGWADAMEATDGPGATGWWSLLEGYRLLRAGRLREAGRRLRTSLETIEGDEDGRYLAYRELAHRDFLAEETDAAIHHARAALELASDDRRQADCYQLLAFALSWACRWRELDEALAAFTANRGADSARLAAKIAGLEAQSAQLQGDLRRALSIGEDSLDGARTHLPRHNLAGYLTLLASLDCFAGRYEASAHLLDEARGLCEAHDLTRVRVYVEVIGSSLLAQQGRLDDCLAALDDALSAPLAQSDPGLLVEVHLRRGTALRRAGSLAMAAQEYGRALCEMGERDSPYDRLDLQLELAFTEGLTGAEKRAPQRIGRLCDDAGARQLRFQEAKGRFYLGVLAARDGRTGEADLAPALAALLRLGHGDFVGQESVGNPEVAQWMQRAETDDDLLREMLATIALQAGGPALLATLAGRSERIGTLVLETAGGDLPARQAFHLQQALRRHPSRSVRDRARAAIRLAGETGERLCPELTPREEEILAVLAEGSSNKEIAQRLFLAVPTVKTHVHRILTKTGQRGRLAVALMYRQRAATARHAGEAGPAGAGAGTNGDAPR